MLSRARLAREAPQAFDWGSSAPEESPRVYIGVPQAAVEPTDEAASVQRLATLERDAFATGYAQGERSGAEAAARRGEAMLRRLTQTIEELSALRTDTIRRTEEQVVQLAMAIARRMVGRELAADRGLLVAMARVALDRLGDTSAATIRLHPEDFAALAPAGGVAPDSSVSIVADPVVARGGCLVQSEFGLMDAGLDSQFDELAGTLLGERPGEAPAETLFEAHALVRR